MERPQDTIEESVESVNAKDQGPSAPGPSEPTIGEHDVHILSTKALFEISQDLTRVLDRLTTLRAPIDSIRKHGEWMERMKEIIKKKQFLV